MMRYEQTVTLTIQYDPENENAPEEWDWISLLDADSPDAVTLEEVRPVVVVQA